MPTRRTNPKILHRTWKTIIRLYPAWTFPLTKATRKSPVLPRSTGAVVAAAATNEEGRAVDRGAEAGDDPEAAVEIVRNPGEGLVAGLGRGETGIVDLEAGEGIVAGPGAAAAADPSRTRRAEAVDDPIRVRVVGIGTNRGSRAGIPEVVRGRIRLGDRIGVNPESTSLVRRLRNLLRPLHTGCLQFIFLFFRFLFFSLLSFSKLALFSRLRHDFIFFFFWVSGLSAKPSMRGASSR